MNVLLVEDHDATRTALAAMLIRWGHKVVAAKDLASALALVKGAVFEVIVSDIALLGGTGYELMLEARRAGVNATGIAISGYPYPDDVNEPKVTGFDHHLRKPIQPEQLQALLDRLDHKEVSEVLPAR